MLRRLAFALTIVAGYAPGAAAHGVAEVRTGFEDATIPPAFVICHRPENEIIISDERARHGERSLELNIHETPLFSKEPPLAMVEWSPSPVSCLMADKLALYQWNTRTAKHYFCSVCGIYTHHERRSVPTEYGFNVACIEGVDLDALGPIGASNGAAQTLVAAVD